MVLTTCLSHVGSCCRGNGARSLTNRKARSPWWPWPWRCFVRNKVVTRSCDGDLHGMGQRCRGCHLGVGKGRATCRAHQGRWTLLVYLEEHFSKYSYSTVLWHEFHVACCEHLCFSSVVVLPSNYVVSRLFEISSIDYTWSFKYGEGTTDSVIFTLRLINQILDAIFSVTIVWRAMASTAAETNNAPPTHTHALSHVVRLDLCAAYTWRDRQVWVRG